MKTLMSIGLLIWVFTTSAVALDATTSPSEPDMLDRAMNSRFVQWLDRTLDERADLRRAEAIKTARVVPRGAQPEFIIRRSGVDEYGDPEFRNGISFNGQVLNQGDTLSKAIAVFGPGYRKHPKGGHQWDELGIHVSSSYHTPPSERGREGEEKIIDYITVYTGASATSTPRIDRPRPLQFPGYLELDGVGIDALTTRSDIMALADREGLKPTHGYIICYGKSKTWRCHVGLSPASKGIAVHTGVPLESDKLYYLTLAFTR